MLTKAAIFHVVIAAICWHFLPTVDSYGQAMSTVTDRHVTISPVRCDFVATIESICQDPIEGYIVKCRTGVTHVLIWDDDVRNLSIGTKYRILCTYVGPMPYPSGDVNVYVSIVWLEVDDA